MKKKVCANVPKTKNPITRRTFLGAAAAGSAALLTGTLGAAVSSGARTAAVSPTGNAPWIEATIPQIQALMASGQLTSLELTRGYMNRIADLNPQLRAVIETNPNAEAIAAQLDNERRKGGLRGPLHGIPILVKDNVATDDAMQTTAGSLALVHSKVPADAPIVARLRAAGAVILGKSNLGEWANFRGFNPLGFYGWSARGGATHNPSVLSYTAGGSSSGSGVAPAVNMCAAAVGTETDGSITVPGNVNLVVGLKPTVGLISQDGIIPIGHSQDTAGPLGRTVTDVAILLGALQTPFAAVAGQPLPGNYTQFLRRGSLHGARIGVDRRYFDYNYFGFPGDEDSVPFAEHALNVMTSLGATIVDTDTGDVFAYLDDELTTLVFEFKVQIAQYLAGLKNTNMRTLADLIAFNLQHCPEELVYYGQELFEIAESTSGDLTDPDYVLARQFALNAARSGIDDAIARDRLDVIVAPHLTNTTGPAVAGYPNLALPIGLRPDGRPAGLLMYSTFLREPTLLSLAYDLEQEMQVRRQPQFLGAVNDPPNAGLCSALPKKPPVFKGKAHLPHGRIFI